VLEAILFYTSAAGLLVFGLLVITRTNPIASALAMVAAFGALSALYALLSASLLAVLQILVYAGGIMVLMVFVIMLLNLHPEDLKPLKANGWVVLLCLFGVLEVALAPLILSLVSFGHWQAAALPPGFGDITTLGEKVFADHLFPFEMLSLLLLVAVVGALVLAKRKL
jgi:NADH-quinone oxidoreductase subunit J